MRILKRMFTPEGWSAAPVPAFVRHGFAALLAASVILPLAGVAPAAAQQKRIVQVPNADYFGGDYRTVKDVDIATCESACLDDRQCKAFTYNTSARWCFLKNAQGELQAFNGAIAGRVVEVRASSTATIAERRAELSFVSNYYMEEAQRYASQVTRTSTPASTPVETQLQQAEQDLLMSSYTQAQAAFSSLLAVDAANSAAWTGLSLAQVNQQPDDWEQRMALRRNSISAAVNGYLNAADSGQQGAALDALSKAFALSQEWKPAIRSLRKARDLNPSDPSLTQRYEKMVADHGFRILDHRVDADAAEPRICVIFSDELEKNRDFSDFVKVQGGNGTAVTSEGSQLCVTGVRHGQRYDMQLRAGVPANDGEKLEKTANLTLYIRDRAPSVHFLGRAYVLPKGKDATIPVVSVNSKEVALEIFRVGDRGLVDVVRDERFMRQLSYYDSNQLEEQLGEKVWSGVVETASPLNEDVTTAIPLEDMGLELKPGVYAMSAKSKLDKTDEWSSKATQWFIVSEIGLSSYSGTEGVIASLRSLSDAKPMAGVKVRLVAVNNEVLGETVSDANGLASFAAGLSRGRGGRAPALVVAETEQGDYSFLDLRKPAFDLSDRGVEGRPAPGPLDVFSWTDKGIYRSGETVHAQALLRTAKADAQTDLPLTFIFIRPDGVEYSRTVINDGGLGGYLQDLSLPAGVQQGSWTLRVYLDPKGNALAEKTFLVEDYQPERVDYTLKASADALSLARPVDVTVEGRFLYGAPAANQTLEGEIIAAPIRNLAGFPGYVFGLVDEGIYPERASLPEGLATDENGVVTFPLALPQLQPTSGLYTSTLITRLVETGGRYVERSLDLPVLPGGPRIGVKPLFSGGVDEGGPADYEIVLVDENGKQIAGKGITWTLSRIDRRYQWYRSDGQWNFEPVTSSERVSSGKIDIPSDGPARLSLPVNWGEYKLEVSLGGSQPAETSDTFSAGWYSAGGSSDTPDRLEVGLDKSAYRPGETAILRLKPKTEGVAVINVFGDGLLETKTVEVDGSETEVSLTVTDDWGAGAYVTATLLRPMDIDAKRMPARSIGLAWGKVEPGERKLAVEITAPDTMRPRQELTATLKLANLPAGDKAYVTLAAVDVGILNLTGYKAPEPSSWYFGQRRLGIEIRDLYGQLIDRTAGTRGTVRSGGDGGSGLKAPPPDEEPVALFSGIVEVSDDGTAAVTFNVPDFNGTLKLMAVAWSASGVGEASRDVQVRDPVVMSTSLPAFMAPGDTSRILIEIDNVDGPAGSYELVTSIDGPVELEDGQTTRTLDLAKGGKLELRLPVKAMEAVGDAAIDLAMSGPEGTTASKSLKLGVRDTQPYSTQTETFELGAGEELVLDSSTLDGFHADTASVSLAIGGKADIDVPGLLDALDRYPYGCTEQTTSRALPLLYLNEVAADAGLGTDPELRERVVNAIARVLANQNYSGSFGMWNSYGESDTWLDAYVTDFLVRAREKGYDVPDVAYTAALDSLQNRVSYANDFSSGGEGIAYALYVLSRTGRASIGDLRYYMDVKFEDFSTPLAKAQVSAALALYGEQQRSARGFEKAADALPLERAGIFRADYGSPVRDAAGILTYMSEAGQSKASGPVADFIAAKQDVTAYNSTQEMAWMLMAARQANEEARKATFTVDGQEQTDRLGWRFSGEDVSDDAVTFVNTSGKPQRVMLTVTGQTTEPLPEGGEGFAISRKIYDLDGAEVDPAAVPYNSRLVVVIEVEPLTENNGRLIVVDRLPGGLVIDNPRLVRSGDLGALSWLNTIDMPDHVEFRQDRFVVSVDQRRFGDPVLTFAYLARAVTPGSYAHPPATVEDMYVTSRYGVTATSRFEILGPVR